MTKKKTRKTKPVAPARRGRSCCERTAERILEELEQALKPRDFDRLLHELTGEGSARAQKRRDVTLGALVVLDDAVKRLQNVSEAWRKELRVP
ncbi:MAG: hypothetical protein AMXMBFR56_66240 [Polyangiaceae bacterium]